MTETENTKTSKHTRLRLDLHNQPNATSDGVGFRSTPLAGRALTLLHSARQQPGPPDCSVPRALPPGSPLERLPGVQPTGLRASPTAACGSLQSSMAAARTPDSEKQGTDSVAAQTYHTHTKRNSKWYFKSLGTPQIPDEPANVRCPPKKEPPLKSQDAASPKKT